MFPRTLSASRRHVIALIAVAALLLATAAMQAQTQGGRQTTPPPQQPPAGQPPAGQPPAGQQPAAQQPAQPAAPQLAFSGEAALVLYQVKEANAADFEAGMAKFKEALEKSTKPEHKQMATGFKLLRGLEGAQPGEVMYVGVVDPVIKGADYDPRKVIAEMFPTDAKAINDKWFASLAGINQLNMRNIK